MKKNYFFLAAAVWLAAVSACAALDSIKTKTGAIAGKIVSSSPLKVESSREPIPNTKKFQSIRLT